MTATNPFLAAVIATCNRPRLLKERALASVLTQTDYPDAVIIADDSDKQHAARNRAVVRAFSRQYGMPVLYVANCRNKGASGTWNTAALALLRQDNNAENIFFSVLDDDDGWLAHHIRDVRKFLSFQPRADIIAAAFERREDDQTLIIRPPQKFYWRDFLPGNPGILGGTMTLRLSAFLRAGMFDESLASCTDRDLCLRLALLGRVRYQPLTTVSVIHYAETNRPRLSAYQAPARLSGLTAFMDKYSHLMNAEERKAFRLRAEEFFGWQDTKGKKVSLPARCKTSRPDGTVALVAGMIVSDVIQAQKLTEDLQKLSADKRLKSLEVVILPAKPNDKKITAWAKRLRTAGVRLYLIPDKRRRKIASTAGNLRGNCPISINRTVLQYHTARVARRLPDAVCWILDGDDIRLFALEENRSGIKQFCPDYIGEILRLRDTGCDAAIGEITGCSPLPRAATIRCQSVDLLHYLAFAVGQSPAKIRHCGQSLARLTEANYFHDYLPHPFLEFPAGLNLLSRQYTPQQYLTALPDLVDKLLRGESVCRPLVVKPADDTQPIQRGGNTLIFNTATLIDMPNGFFHHSAGAFMRRSDAVWSALNKGFGQQIVRGDFPVFQSRRQAAAVAPDVQRLAQDICGQGIVKALTKICAGRKFADISALVAFLSEDKNGFFTAVNARIDERLIAVKAAFLRIQGIADSMQSLTDEAATSHPISADVRQRIVQAATKLKKRFSARSVRALENKVRTLADQAISQQMLKQFADAHTEFNAAKKYDKQNEQWKAWLRKEQTENAHALLARHAAGSSSPQLLGVGHEGVTFRVGPSVWKVLFHWFSLLEARINRRTPDITAMGGTNFLPGKVNRWKDEGGLYPLLDVHRDGDDLLLAYPFEKTHAYTGGMGRGWVSLLADMLRKKTICSDFKPDNLRRAGDVLRLIDYGRNINPYTDADFSLIVRKAWLCCFWAFRRDLSQLTTASLTDGNLPELQGYEKMETAAKNYSQNSRLPDSIVPQVLAGNPRTVLDYGYGGSRDTLTYVGRGIAASAYDVTPSQKYTKMLNEGGVKILKDEKALLNSGTYDAIQLRHVLCEIFSLKALRQCLQNVRHLIAPTGTVFFGFCDPNGMVKNTMTAGYGITRRTNFEQPFKYKKLIRQTGTVRAHQYYPEHFIRREIARAGFRIVERNAAPDTDIERFEDCAGTLTYRCRPLPPLPSVALLIRACAMDAQTLSVQVRHLVEQLNYPRGFTEIVLAVDSRADDFIRSYTRGDLALLNREARRLKKEGWIDKIVYVPENTAALKKMNQLWFGCDVAHTHTDKGAPTACVIAAFDSIAADYVLHIDTDMLVGRYDPAHDFLSAMIADMKKFGALTAALDIAGEAKSVADKKFHLEVRAGLTDLRRLKKLRPLPNSSVAGAFSFSWHRAADRVIQNKNLPSLRYGDQRLFTVHPPNRYKNRREALFNVMDAVEKGEHPPAQMARTEWNGTDSDWLFKKRREDFVAVICGRNVSRGRLEKCLQSLFRQKNRNWGAVIIDDASAPTAAAYLRRRLADFPQFAEKITLILRRERMGGLRNLHFAVRQLCDNPQSVIVTLDTDDCLIGDKVFDVLSDAYGNGADLTVGGMLRTDKQADYPPQFVAPRRCRGGNVWQHLRSFRKHLFDAVPDEYFLLDGEFIDCAGDWAYMLPMVEMAQRPLHIRQPLYLYERDKKISDKDRALREAIIARIVAKPSCADKKIKNRKRA